MRATFFFGATLRFGAALRAPMYTAGDVAAAERTATCEASGAWKPAASAARQNSTSARSISMRGCEPEIHELASRRAEEDRVTRAEIFKDAQ